MFLFHVFPVHVQSASGVWEFVTVRLLWWHCDALGHLAQSTCTSCVLGFSVVVLQMVPVYQLALVPRLCPGAPAQLCLQYAIRFIFLFMYSQCMSSQPVGVWEFVTV